MNIIVSRNFIENFGLENNIETVANILNNYSNLVYWIDFKMEEVENEDSFLQIFKNAVLINEVNEIDSIETATKDSLYINSISNVLIFKMGDEILSNDFKDSHLIFNYNEFESSVESLQKKVQMKLLRSQKGFFEKFSKKSYGLKEFSFKNLFIVDKYLIGSESKGRDYKKDNLKELSRLLISEDSEIRSVFFFIEFNQTTKSDKFDLSRIKLMHQSLNSWFANKKIKFYFFDTFAIKQFGEINLHDRIILHPIWNLESTNGFNILQDEKTNSKIESSSFFSEFDYQRRVEHLNKFKLYFEKLGRGNKLQLDPYFYPENIDFKKLSVLL